MGQAKQRGTYEQRKAAAIAAKPAPRSIRGISKSYLVAFLSALGMTSFKGR